jgi:hypothetical protein
MSREIKTTGTAEQAESVSHYAKAISVGPADGHPTNGRLNIVRGHLGWNMFPDPYNGPACSSKAFRIMRVTRTVSCEFGLPIDRIVPRLHPVIWT